LLQRENKKPGSVRPLSEKAPDWETTKVSRNVKSGLKAQVLLNQLARGERNSLADPCPVGVQ